MEKSQNSDIEEVESKSLVEEEVNFIFQRKKKKKMSRISRVGLRSIDHHKILNKISRRSRKFTTQFKKISPVFSRKNFSTPQNDISSYHFKKMSKQSFNNLSQGIDESNREIKISDSPDNNLSFLASRNLTPKVKEKEKVEELKKKGAIVIKKLKKNKIELITPKFRKKNQKKKDIERIILEKKGKKEKMTFEKYVQSERQCLNPEGDVDECELGLFEGSERAIVGKVRVGDVNSSINTFRDKKQQNKETGSNSSNNLKKKN